MYFHLGQPTQTPAPPRGISVPPPPPVVMPPTAPLQLPRSPLTRVPDTRQEPFAFICRIVTKPVDKPGVFVGTGILLSPFHVLTCAHNIFPPKAPRTKEIIVFPGQNGPDPACHVRANGWNINPVWRGMSCNTPAEDYGIIRLSCPMAPGFFPLKPFDVTRLVGASVSLAGYPQDREPMARHMYFSRGSITGAIRIRSCTGDAATGTATGERLPSISEATYLIAHDVDTAPSQSGSPMWIVQDGGRVLVGIHTGKIDQNRQGKAVLLNQSVRMMVVGMMSALPPLPV